MSIFLSPGYKPKKSLQLQLLMLCLENNLSHVIRFEEGLILADRSHVSCQHWLQPTGSFVLKCECESQNCLEGELIQIPAERLFSPRDWHHTIPYHGQPIQWGAPGKPLRLGLAPETGTHPSTNLLATKPCSCQLSNAFNKFLLGGWIYVCVFLLGGGYVHVYVCVRGGCS